MFLQDMHGSLKRLMEVEEQIASQQKYSRPSDNPSEVTRGMTVGTSIARNDQYQRNLNDAVTWLSNTDTALEQVTNLVSSIREQVVYACDGGLSGVDREALARDIAAMKDELIQTANFDVEGCFLLSGYDTSTKPFADDGTGHVTYRGDDGRIIFEVEKAQTGQVSLNGRDVFPLSFERQSVTSVEVPLDFRWEGTSEELRISVGDRSASLWIPERWSDTNDDSLADATDYDGFRSPEEKVKGYSLSEIVELINGSDAGRLVHASVEKDALSGTQRLKLQSLTGEPLRVVSLPDTNRIVDGQKVVSNDVPSPATWTASAGTIEVDFADGRHFVVDIEVGDTLEDIADSLFMIESLWAGVKSDGTDGTIELVGSDPENTFTVTATGGGIALFPDAVSSKPLERETDTAHLGLASFLGLETATVSKHYADGGFLGNTTTDTLDMVFVSGDRKMNLVINDEAELTLEEFATRLQAAAGDWLDVVVQKEPEISGVNGHLESESSRLVITTRDGAPLSVYDKTNAYARKMGISSGLVTKDLTGIAFPDTPSSDVPALIGIEVGGELHRVALLGEDVADDSGNMDPQKLSEQIRRQVGSDVIGADLVDGDRSLALYSKTGEPMRVIDLPYADPSLGGRSSGLAVEMGLHAGITGGWVDGTPAGAAGRFVVETEGRRLEVPVAATDTLDEIASKLRDLAGGWLDVSIAADGTNNRRLALAARDGSPLNVYDLTGDAAGTFKINTDIRVKAVAGALPVDDVFSIDVDGYSVDIDLTDITNLQGIANHINARFGGEDVRAEVVYNAGTDELVLLSPRGKSITVNVPGGLTLPGGTKTPQRSAAEEAGPYAQMVTTRTGADVQQGDLFALLEDLVPAIEQGAVEGLSDSFLPRLDVAMDDVLSARATCGALRRRYETALSRLKDDNLAMTELESGIMDVDIAEAAVEFQTAQTVYQATLATISKVMQPTLVDYLT
jgi:flagellar hook-associated protein 3 FlgL